MNSNGSTNGNYPRALRDVERALLEFTLPLNRPGYKIYRETLDHMTVLAQGHRGTGHLILGLPGARPDLDSPLTPVVAYGAMETSGSRLSVAVHELIDEQIDIEVITEPETARNTTFDGGRRWTYSSWSPGEPSPSSGSAVREVSIAAGYTLALCSDDRRIWLHDTTSGMNRLIPITTFHGELRKRENIRDPKIALQPGTLFERLPGYSDESIRTAFLAYNVVHPKIGDIVRPGEVATRKIKARVLGFLRSLSRHG